MVGVILILALVAAGVHTGNGWFYLAAGVLGGVALIIQMLVVGIIKAASSQIKEVHNNLNNKPLRIRGRKPL